MNLVEMEGLVEDYLQGRDWRIRENSNMGFSLQGLHNHITQSVVAAYWLDRLYPPDVAEAHREGDIHIHDLGVLGPYCVGWDLRDFLLRGFAGVSGRAASRPPRHFRAALGQLVNLLYTLQGEAAGAQAVSSVDTLLAPFIRADGLSYAEVKQALQEWVYNLNVPTRVGFQAPFTNITLDVVCPAAYRDLPVVLGGVEHPGICYGDFQREMDLFNQAFAEVMLEGDANGRGFTFPIPTYNLTRQFPWESAVGEAIARMTARYGTPYFANFVSSDLSPDDVRSMCCRLRLDNRELRRRGGGYFGANPLTGSIGVVTINLPRLGYLSQSEEEFLNGLSDLMDLARDSLVIKRELLERLTHEGLYPYSRVYLDGVKDRMGAYWANHFSTIGLIGMNEACLNLFGLGIDDERCRAFALRVLRWMKERLRQYQEETGVLFNLEATPAEGATYRLARLDRRRFPGIRQAGTEEAPYYTNSTMLPVGYSDDPFVVLDHQEELQCEYTGGTVVHLFLGERVEDPRAAAELVQTIASRYRIPYFTLTPTYSVCPTHGYLVGEQPTCPACGGPAEVWSRIVGYYRPVANWNPGKQQEFRERKVFRLPAGARR